MIRMGSPGRLIVHRMQCEGMDFGIKEEMKMLVNGVRRFVDQRVGSLAVLIDEEDRIPGEIVRRRKEMGLFGLNTTEKHGGIGRVTGIDGAPQKYRKTSSRRSYCENTRIRPHHRGREESFCCRGGCEIFGRTGHARNPAWRGSACS